MSENLTPNDIPEESCKCDIIEKIGFGGMGVVYRARHRIGGFELALKKSRLGHESRLRREFDALRNFDHGGIVALCPGLRSGICSAPPHGHLCLELLNGASCQEFGQCSDWQQALQVLLEVSAAVGYIHSREWIHRDLKPSNVVLSSSGKVKLIDFGLARALGGVESAAQHTRTGAGTKNYMAPEQFYENPTKHTPAVDSFALGGLFFFLLTGRAPERDLIQEKWQFPRLVEHLDPGGATSLFQDCNEIITGCTQVHPESRWTAHDVSTEVSSIMKRHDLLLSRVLPAPRPVPATVSAPPQTRIFDYAIRESEGSSADRLTELVPGTLYRTARKAHYFLYESGLRARDRLPLSAIDELRAIPITRNSWLRAGKKSSSTLELVSDFVLRHLDTEGTAAKERLIARFGACALESPSLTMFEIPRGPARRLVGCRVSESSEALSNRPARSPNSRVSTLHFFAADLESTRDIESTLATITLVHDFVGTPR